MIYPDIYARTRQDFYFSGPFKEIERSIQKRNNVFLVDKRRWIQDSEFIFLPLLILLPTIASKASGYFTVP